MSGCGGGSTAAATSPDTSSSSPTTTTTPTKVASVNTNTATAEIFNLLTSQPDITGLILDAHGVQGLKVSCDGVDSFTKANGTFICKKFPMSVYLGEFKIGEIAELPLDKVVYTQDLLHIPRGATTHPDVTKMSLLLQSLDEDGYPLNGITLTEGTFSLLNSHLSQNDVLANIALEDIQYFIEDVITIKRERDPNALLQKVSVETAQDNLTHMVATSPALTYQTRSLRSSSL
jgi:hypothetical protein